MRKEIKECFGITDQLLQLSQLKIKEMTDEDYISIEQLLSKREQLLQAFKPPFSEKEQRVGAVMVEWNKQLNENLVLIKNAIQLEMKQLKKNDQNTQKYLGQYTINIDGMFYDKRH